MSDAFRRRLHESLGGAFTVERELGGGMSRVCSSPATRRSLATSS